MPMMNSLKIKINEIELINCNNPIELVENEIPLGYEIKDSQLIRDPFANGFIFQVEIERKRDGDQYLLF